MLARGARPTTRPQSAETRPGIEPGQGEPPRVDVNMKHHQLTFALPNGSTMATAQEKNDGVHESAKHGARHVEVGGTSCVSETARGGRGAKPPRLTLGCKRKFGQILANFGKMTPQL